MRRGVRRDEERTSYFVFRKGDILTRLHHSCRAAAPSENTLGASISSSIYSCSFFPLPPVPTRLSSVQPVAWAVTSHDAGSPVLSKYRWEKPHRKEKGPHELKAEGCFDETTALLVVLVVVVEGGD